MEHSSGSRPQAPTKNKGTITNIFNRKLLLYGGCRQVQRKGDMWIYSIVENHWTDLTKSKKVKGKKVSSHSAAYFGNMLIVTNIHPEVLGMYSLTTLEPRFEQERVVCHVTRRPSLLQQAYDTK